MHAKKRPFRYQYLTETISSRKVSLNLTLFYRSVKCCRFVGIFRKLTILWTERNFWSISRLPLFQWESNFKMPPISLPLNLRSSIIFCCQNSDKPYYFIRSSDDLYVSQGSDCGRESDGARQAPAGLSSPIKLASLPCSWQLLMLLPTSASNTCSSGTPTPGVTVASWQHLTAQKCQRFSLAGTVPWLAPFQCII